MPRIEKDSEREDRIAMEAIVDANGREEQAMGWYYSMIKFFKLEIYFMKR
jgi:hypothetical protein